MKNPETPNINMNNPAIAKAASLADFDKLSPEELAESKIDVMRRKAAAVRESQSKEEGIEEGIEKGKIIERTKAEEKNVQMILEMHEDGMSITRIAKFVQKTEEEVQQIIVKHKQ